MLASAVDRGKSVINLFPASTSFSVNTNGIVSSGAKHSAADADNVLDNLDFSAKPSRFQNLSTTNEHIFVLSDFQKNTFTPAYLRQLDSLSQVHLVPLQAESINNVTVDSVFLEDEFIRVGGDNTLHIKVYNAGNNPVDGCPVKLFIDEKQVAALSLDLPAKQVTEATITFGIPGAGSMKKAYVTLEDYPVDFDNTYYFILSPSGSIQISEISDQPSGSLSKLYGHEPFFKINTFDAKSINYGTVSASNTILLNNLPVISAGLAATAANFVKAGGTLIILPSSSGEQSSYTSLFEALSIPATLTGTLDNVAKTALQAPDPKKPFFKSIFSTFDPKMQMPLATRSLAWSRASEDILKFRGGAPFLSRFDRGKGQVYLMASPLDDKYNELMNHALLVPIMYRMAILSYKQEQQLAYSLAGGTVSLPVTTVKKEGIYKLEKDSLSFIPDQQVRAGKLYFDIPADMADAGFYDLKSDGATVAKLAFNFDKKESYLEQYTPEELRNLLPKGKTNIHVYDYGDNFSVKGEFEKRFFGVKLWKYCLILCLFFLMAEIALIRLL
ncbi:hypothetical protein [Pontibacter vulgaris]|uniref:hypothetical protein n=1 Tax=Pontibacter vulgaris TaxID=2905679 RepID=UPI001FA725B5|nr:hypothetical protein [Pontibacter vulgaris]